MENSHTKIINTENSAFYNWGDNCSGWHFVDTEELSVIRESMPAGTSEKLHFHNKALQFFYILSGTASFKVNGLSCEVTAGQGIKIEPTQAHQVANNCTNTLEFIVVSSPKSHGDRTDLEK